MICFVVKGYYSDREENKETSEQIQNLTRYLEEIVPSKPLIILDYDLDNNSKRVNLFKEYLYECDKVLSLNTLAREVEPKKEVKIFVRNLGKSTKQLTLNVECDISPFYICKENDSDIINRGTVSTNIFQYEIPEINAQKDYYLILLFENNSPTECEIGYSSEEIVNEVKKLNIVE